MKTANIAFVAVVLLSVALLAAPASVMADGGKMVVVNYLWPSPPPPPPTVMNFGNAVQKPQLPPARAFEDQHTNDYVQKADPDAKNVEMSDDNSYRVVLPKPGGDGDVLKGWNPLDPESVETDWSRWLEEWSTKLSRNTVGADEREKSHAGFATGFLNGPDNVYYALNQNAVVAWNGHEELLILSTNEKSLLPEGSAMLSVIPLPGKPISVERASLRSFAAAKAIWVEKNGEHLPQVIRSVFTTKIGVHSVFVMEIESKDDFLSKVQYSIANFYNNKAAAVITPDALKVVEQYLKEGFHYFAFDLTFVDDEYSTKEAIAYRFESSYIYFPLRISQVGGVGDTFVDLVVLTPMGEKKLTFSSRSGIDGRDGSLGTKFVREPFSSKDLADIDASLPSLFGNQTVYGRRITFRSYKIDGFQNDFELIPSN
ncbi:MAG: hypothetical protein IJL92_02530 [Thermoguttaceae bacterium]|nr:hypothetical protein [Thermoguttaceae bacterium]